MSRPLASLLLLLCTMFWGFAFIAQKSAMDSMGPLTFAGVRYLLGGLLVLPLALWERRRRTAPLTGVHWGFITAMSLVFFIGSWLQQAGLATTTATNGGFLTGLYVFFVLRHLYAPTGLLELSDRLLHYVAPLLYILWWVIGQPHGQLRWGNLPVMLLPTLIYFVVVMMRGAWLHRYPYPFMNIDELGIGAVLLGALFMAAGLAALSALVIALDHFLTRNWNLVHE